MVLLEIRLLHDDGTSNETGICAGQLEAFVDEVIQEPVVVVCNSVGGMSGLCLAHKVFRSLLPSFPQRVYVQRYPTACTSLALLPGDSRVIDSNRELAKLSRARAQVVVEVVLLSTCRMLCVLHQQWRGVQGTAMYFWSTLHEMSFLFCAVQAPDKVKAVQLLNVSLRALHVSKQPALARPLIAAFQSVLRETPAGEMFFNSVAKPEAIKNVLSQAYYDSSTVTDELVDCLLKPGMQPGAARVFLDFIRCTRVLILPFFWVLPFLNLSGCE